MRTSIPLRLAALSLVASVVVPFAARAQAPSPTIMPSNTISVTSFSPDSFFLNNLAVSIELRHTVAGMTPSHYRVSHFSDFRDAQWLAYTPSPRVTTVASWFTPDPGSNNSRFSTILYFQLRARNPNAGRPVALNGSGLPQSPGSQPEKSSGVTVQPDFINSNIRNKAIKVVFAG